MAKAKKEVAEPTLREKKKLFIVSVATRLNGEIKKTSSYPEANSNEKALKLAMAEDHEGELIGAQISGVYSSTKELIKAMQIK